MTVLEGEAVEWAGAVLLAFNDMQVHELTEFRLLRFLRELTHRAKRGSRQMATEVHFRKLGYEAINLDDDMRFEIPDTQYDPGRLVPAAHELRERLHLESLTRRERQVLAMRMKDMPFDEIGRKLGISPATARVLMHRVRRASGRTIRRRDRRAR